ncbi:MAG TPA: hypothetical protein VIC87_05195, partial [Vicinamibacteria bacterium]
FRHWDQWGRVPPVDLATHYVPRLGAYDSRSPDVLERHARWIAESGAGSLNLSWWGRDSFEDAMVPRVMDVARDHGLRVTFHLEPYLDDHGRRFAEDVLYLVREYGRKRSFDALLLVSDAAGREGPVFKGFRTIVPPDATDCHGVTRKVADHTGDEVWRRQLDFLRKTLAPEFASPVFLADTVDVLRAAAAGFDGVAVYDNDVGPHSYPRLAALASALRLLFSFNVNPGFDGIGPRARRTGSCEATPELVPSPSPPVDWSRPSERERAARLSTERIRASFDAAVAVQEDPTLTNARRGFFLVYLNSFNEWHEGHAFEPMLDGAELAPAQRRLGYHNPDSGDYRLAALRARLRAFLAARGGGRTLSRGSCESEVPRE